MRKNRLEAFSDGVIAIIITIMVLEMKVPHGAAFSDLRPLLPVFLSYVLSYLYIGIYWNNHHHLLHAAAKVSGGVLWANLHLLFWLSLMPFGTGWMGENHFAPLPTALYGFDLLMSAIAFTLLQRAIVAADGPNSTLARAIGPDRKGQVSRLVYLLAIPVAFWFPWLATGLFALVALMWFIPDRRIERELRTAGGGGGSPDAT
jgi:uncharacterized membrane protein